jgi:group I intron endonuclease
MKSSINQILKQPCVYQITHLASGKFYVGSTFNFAIRKYCHMSRASGCTKLKNAILQYGVEAFEVKVLEYCEKDVLTEREQCWLDLLQPFGDRGYNIARVAAAPPTTGIPRSEETKQKLREANKGKVVSQETRKKISEANRGRKLPPRTKEHCKKIRLAKLGKKRKPLSEETKRKIGEANRGRKHPPQSPESIAKRAEANRGRKHSEETKQKMREAQRRRRAAEAANFVSSSSESAK